jgi:hypothetical protein
MPSRSGLNVPGAPSHGRKSGLSVPGAASTVAKLFVFAGQSNMDGGGAAPQGDYGTLNPKIKIWYSGAWETYDPAANASSQTVGHWGPEGRFLFDYAAAHPSETIYAVKHATPSTNLAVDWKQDGSGAQWEVLEAVFNAAYADLVGQELTVTPVLSWMQGEDDSNNLTYANAYEANLTTFLASVRTLMGASTKVIIGRVAASQTYSATVRAAQLAVSNADGNAPIISTDAIPISGVHYTVPDGENQLGDYFYQSYAGIYADTPTSFGVTWETGFETGVVPGNITNGTKIGTLSATNTSVGGSLTFAELTDPSSVIAVSTADLQKSGTVVDGNVYDFSVRVTNNLGRTADLASAITGAADLPAPPDVSFDYLFASGEPGILWNIKPSTLFTDTGMTTNVTTDGDIPLRIQDTSGNGHHGVIANCTYRTNGTLHWLEMGSGGNIGVAIATLGNGSSVLTAYEPSSGPTIWVTAYDSASGSKFVGVPQSGSGSDSYSGVGSLITNHVNGVATSDQTRGALWTALSPPSTKVLEVRGIEFATLVLPGAWTRFDFGGYSGAAFLGKIFGVIVHADISSPDRETTITNLGTKSGLTL